MRETNHGSRDTSVCRPGCETGIGGRQRGVSLVELMVALAIGLLVMAGMTRLFIEYQGIYRLQASLSRMQEDGRFALDVIDRELRKAGYAPRTAPDAFPAGNGFAASASVAGDDHRLRVRYRGSTRAPLQNCLGGWVDRDASGVTRFTVGDEPGLRCAVGDHSPQPLEHHVAAMAVRYFAAGRWRRAAGVGDWAAVTGVHVELLLVSRQAGLLDAPQTYSFDGKAVTATDRRLRRVYATTVRLRNVPPETGT
ncbi:PilW family protein [Modicisalibacter tunisiensis]|uniref:PilW family protein n=1 Tax=Modicisalibacter tunisiensis TaxID=390637 RepID=A0ABS7WVE6_9GAMM|nr:PilW family protein [Modicisalibacter tunisiensis]MBZ9566583.1 PilW family protein [Modicisalibacter tunisiensis]